MRLDFPEFERRSAINLFTLGLPAILVIPAILATPAAVSAQTPGNISINLSEVADGATVLRDAGDEDLNRPFNAAECATSDTVTATFTLQSLPAGTTFVDMWLGSSGQDCSTETARQTGDQRQCTHLSSDPTVQTIDGTIVVSLTELLNPDNSACDSSPAQGETFNLWLFASGATETTAAVTVDQYGFISFTVDASAPTAPVVDGTGNAAGNTGIPVSWEGGSEANLEYNVYVDTTASGCTGGAFTPGGVASGTPTAEGITGTSYSVDAEAAGLAVGDSALVYVATVDLAENISALSTAVCVTRVETVGFCDALASSGTECTNTCTVRPGSNGGGPSGWLLVGAALLLLGRAHRRVRA